MLFRSCMLKSCNNGRAAHEHAPLRGRAKTSLPDRALIIDTTWLPLAPVLVSIASRSFFLSGQLLFGNLSKTVVVVGNAPHDRSSFLVCHLISNRASFLCTKAPMRRTQTNFPAGIPKTSWPKPSLAPTRDQCTIGRTWSRWLRPTKAHVDCDTKSAAALPIRSPRRRWRAASPVLRGRVPSRS